jgi:hypothetical protein
MAGMREVESLFDRALDSEPLDQTYLHVRDSKYCAGHRAYLDAAWATFREHADPEFATEFRRPGQFQGRAWELRIAWTLRDIGLDFSGPKPGPDFAVSVKGRTVFLEAIAPQSTQELTANYEAATKFGAVVPDRQIILRYTSAIEEKMRKLFAYRSKGIVQPHEPYVIALSGANIRQSSIEEWPFPRILKPLFGIGEAYVSVPVGGHGESTTGIHRREQMTTANGGSVSCGLFLQNGHRDLSAVVFTPWDIKNRPESNGRPPGSDFVVVHNPHSANPIPEGMIPRGTEWNARDGNLELIADRRPTGPA